MAVQIDPNSIYTMDEVMEMFKVSQPTLTKWVREYGLKGQTAAGGIRGYRFFVGSNLLDFFGKQSANEPVND